jgi:hypothetical protein
MPVVFAPLVGVLVGLIFAWLGREALSRTSADSGTYAGTSYWSARPFQVSVAYALTVHLPVCAYFLLFYGDWSYLYLISWARIPSAVDLLLVLVAASSCPLAFLAFAGYSIRGRFDVLSRTWLFVLLVLIGGAAFAWPRLAISSSFAQYKERFGMVGTAGSSLGLASLLAWAALIGGAYWGVRNLRAKVSESDP